MGDTGPGLASGLATQQPDGVSLAIVALRVAGAERFDPIGFHYLEVLACRTNAQNGSVRRNLESKLKHALDCFQYRFRQARCDVNDAIAQVTLNYPLATVELQELLNTGDLKALRKLTRELTSGTQRDALGDLLRHLTPYSARNVAHLSPENIGSSVELKSVRQFRNTWSQLSANRQVVHALSQVPKNAGPINSHMLVLRSIALMRDISPDYLTRFVSYVDTLLCLDQVDKVNQGAARVAGGNVKGKRSGSQGLRR